MKYLLTIFILLAACSSPEDVCSRRLGIHEWTGYRWSPDNHELSVGDATSGQFWDETLDETMDDWNDLNSNLYMVPATTTSPDILVREVTGEDWLGVAEIYLSDEGYINKARVSLNAEKLAGYSRGGKKHVLCQELGHALGLFHIEGNTCMDDCSNYRPNSGNKKQCVNDLSKTLPNEHDAEQLILMYGEYIPEEECNE